MVGVKILKRVLTTTTPLVTNVKLIKRLIETKEKMVVYTVGTAIIGFLIVPGVNLKKDGIKKKEEWETKDFAPNRVLKIELQKKKTVMVLQNLKLNNNMSKN